MRPSLPRRLALTFLCLAAYARKLEELIPPAPADPKHCGDLNCRERPICYTDYKPHYSALTLASQVVGMTEGWVQDNSTYGDWSLHYGFLDWKNAFYADKTDKPAELYVKVSIGEKDSVWLFDDLGGSLKTCCSFRLDAHVSADKLTHYTPSSNTADWPHSLIHGSGAVVIHSLPKGDHVLSIIKAPENTAKLTHVVKWA